MANPTLIKSFDAEGVVAAYRIVKFGAADYGVLQAAAATDLQIGVTGELGAAAAGARVDVVVAGIADVTFGGAVTRGQEITSDANGKAIAAAPGAGVNNRVVGVALVSAVAGDIGPILLAPSVKQG